ncbi:hypothetical protein HDV05_003049, partial [Chytridiales sp. JEL 0842]
SEVEYYGDIVRRQIFESNQKFVVIAECLDHIKRNCEDLRNVGLELSFVLDQLFHEDIISAIDVYCNRTKELIVSHLKKDTFEITHLTSDITYGHELFLLQKQTVTISVLQLYDIFMEFGADMGLIISIS